MDSYETGSTRPPKKHRGMFALVLVGGIVLGSILTAFGGINFRLLQQWNRRDKENNLPVSLYTGETDQTVPSVPDETAVPQPTGEASVQLNPSPQGLENVAQEGGMSLQAIYEKCIPSTVSILCTLPRGSATGSGVVLSSDGYVITNYHVVYDSAAKEEDGISQNIHVYLRGGSEIMEATFVGGSPIYDIAVLRVEDNAVLRASAAEAVKVRNSDTLQVGETSYAVGNPEAGGISATAGIVSVDSEYITMNAVDGSATNVRFRVVRVDAAINSGNSGGGLYDAQGNLIGITNAKISSSTVENIGFAIPTTVAVAVAQNVIDYHEEDPQNDGVYRALMGITTTISASSMTYDPQTGLTGLTQTVLVDVVSEDVDLMEQVWNYGYVGDDVRTVDVTVRRLREKIERNTNQPEFILTKWKVGYYFTDQD